ncbi:MAG: AarF/UbiB family protein [Cyclobacteriaceae bacterium]|nr:AarF/UbiB family protein [Cyclobacteriaceae bacterium]
MIFNQTIKNINRIRSVIQVLLKYGFEDVVVNTPLKNLIPQNKKINWARQDKSIFEYSRWERVRMVTEELGATFIKLAQVLSNRPDILPSELIDELEKLQDEAAPFSPEQARAIIEEETGQSVDELFSYFEDRPMGSASIGQVHRARLQDGKDVVVKVRRPKVKQLVRTDLELLKEFIRLTENYLKRQGILNPMDIVETFEATIKKELDYGIEARNLQQFRNFYAKETRFSVPIAFKELSTEKVLVMELVHGCKITDTQQMEAWGLDPRKIAETGMDIYLKQIFEFGYFHADPHPGNILVQKDGSICLIDFGMVGKLLKRDKLAFAGIIVSMANKDPRSMALNFRRLAIDSDIEDMRNFEYRLSELIEEFASLELEEINMSALTIGLQRIIYDYKLKIPGSVFLILRALVILEGIGERIHPEFQTFEFFKPYGRKIMMEQFSIKDITSDILFTGSQFLSFLNKFPGEFKYILKKVRKGELHFNVHYHGFEPLTKKINSVANRLVLTLLICTLVMASTLVLINHVGHSWYGAPVLTWIGYTLAGFLSLLLLLSVLRNRR